MSLSVLCIAARYTPLRSSSENFIAKIVNFFPQGMRHLSTYVVQRQLCFVIGYVLWLGSLSSHFCTTCSLECNSTASWTILNNGNTRPSHQLNRNNWKLALQMNGIVEQYKLFVQTLLYCWSIESVSGKLTLTQTEIVSIDMNYDHWYQYQNYDIYNVREHSSAFANDIQWKTTFNQQTYDNWDYWVCKYAKYCLVVFIQSFQVWRTYTIVRWWTVHQRLRLCLTIQQTIVLGLL